MSDPVKPVVTMKEWGVVPGSDDPYLPPEYAGIRLKGTVFGHPKHADGEVVTTGRVHSVNGRTIETSRTVYVLDGPPHPLYLQFCAANGIAPPDDANPIRVRTLVGG
jgi:hypothetical protein